MGAGPKQGGMSPMDIYFRSIREGEQPPTGFEAFNTKTVACYEAATVSFPPALLYHWPSIRL